MRMHARAWLVWLITCTIVALLIQPVAAAPLAAPLDEPVGPGWTTPAPLAPDDLPTLQSEPALALAGERTLAGWTDSRNASPDLYTAWWNGDQFGGEARATNLTPHFAAQRAFGGAVAVETSGRAFAAYSDGEQIYLVRYDPTAARWSAPVQVSQGPDAWHAVARYPQLATDGAGALVIVWEDFRNARPDDDWAASKGSDIYATRCDGDAMTCAGGNTKLNSDATRGDQRRPRLSRRDSQLAVVWEDHREYGAESPQVYAALSNDGGASWGVNRRVSTPGTTPERRDSATHPAVAFAADGSLFAAWEHHVGAATAPADIYAASWNGSTWSAPQRVDGAPPRVRSLAPTLAAGDAGLFVAWQDYRAGSSNADIYAARWTGASWSEQLVAAAPGMQTQPALAASGARVRIVWQDARQGNQDIFTATWQGSAWSDATQVNVNAARTPYQMAPTLASFSGATQAVFLDNRKGYDELWTSTLPFERDAWSAPARLPTWANAGGDLATEGAQIAVDGAGQWHAVWSEYVWPYGRHIHYSVYQSGKWRDPVRLSGDEDDGRERVAPVVAARSGVVAVAWTDRDAQGTVQLYTTVNTSAGWSAPAPVLTAPIPERWVLPATIGLSDSQLFVAWGEERTNGRGRILVARRALQGGGWGYTQVSPPVESDWCVQEHPQLRTDAAGKVHVVWSGCALRAPPDAWPHDSFVFYAVSTDGGATFGAPVRVGLTIAREDEAHHNDTASRPALATGADGEVMVLYPSRVEGRWTFYAALLQNATVTMIQRIGDPGADWAPAAAYDGRWYGGDSGGAVSYDAVRQRFVVLFPDRRNQRAPTLYAATYGGIDIELLPRLYLPAVRR